MSDAPPESRVRQLVWETMSPTAPDAAADAVARNAVPSSRLTLAGESDLPRSVVVFRALQLGDLLCAVPAMRALRAGLPHAQIKLVGLPWAEAFVKRFSHYLDGFIPFPGWPGLPERDVDASEIPGFLDAVRRQKFDLAVQLHGTGAIVNPIVGEFGARQTAGFVLKTKPTPEGTFATWPEHGREVDRLLVLTTLLGYRPRGTSLEFPLEPSDFADLRRTMEGQPELRNYVVLHPGASVESKRWSPANFARVGDALADEGLTVVLTGTAEERAVTADVAARMNNLAIDLSGTTTLGSLALLVDGARLVVTNDTSVSHLADARRKPSVVVFVSSDVHRWAPADRSVHRVVMGRIPGATDRAIGHGLELVSRAAHRAPVTLNAA